MFDFIIDPITNLKYSIKSKQGKKLLYKYLTQITNQTGGRQNDENQDSIIEKAIVDKDQKAWDSISDSFKCKIINDKDEIRECKERKEKMEREQAELIKKQQKEVNDILAQVSTLEKEELAAAGDKDYDLAKNKLHKRFELLIDAQTKNNEIENEADRDKTIDNKIDKIKSTMPIENFNIQKGSGQNFDIISSFFR